MTWMAPQAHVPVSEWLVYPTFPTKQVDCLADISIKWDDVLDPPSAAKLCK